ncbi:hypothetical protein CC2G_012867 [Coprinopsis cinerea AmutBmut pab1-1]|nr:hypothetical protein CC2G_012867 [Coprinopsis cinerea AmutBmut pab1-1]
MVLSAYRAYAPPPPTKRQRRDSESHHDSGRPAVEYRSEYDLEVYSGGRPPTLSRADFGPRDDRDRVERSEREYNTLPSSSTHMSPEGIPASPSIVPGAQQPPTTSAHAPPLLGPPPSYRVDLHSSSNQPSLPTQSYHFRAHPQSVQHQRDQPTQQHSSTAPAQGTTTREQREQTLQFSTRERESYRAQPPTLQQQQYPVFPPHPPPHPSQEQQRQPRPTHSRTNSKVMNGNPGPSSSASMAGPSDALPPLSLSILGVEPLDEFIKEIADFVHHMIMTKPPHLEGLVEVEAKVGVLRERTGSRMVLPVLVESILQPDALDVRFESNMSAHQHKHFNTLLNNLKTSSDSPSHPSTPVTYSHLYLVDSFYASEPLFNGDVRLKGSDKIRVTRDEKTREVVQCVKKIRLGDLNVFSPKRNADWRISVNLEVPGEMFMPLVWSGRHY